MRKLPEPEERVRLPQSAEDALARIEAEQGADVAALVRLSMEEDAREIAWETHWERYEEARQAAGVVPGKEGAEARKGSWRLLPPADPLAGSIQVTDTPVYDLAEAAFELLLKSNDPAHLFVREGELVRLKPRQDGAPRIGLCTPSDLRGWLDLWGRWVTRSKRGETSVASCPAEVVTALMARGAWGYLPPLQGIVAAPLFGPDGRLCRTPGYLKDLGLYYHEGGCEVPDVAKKPDADAWWAARELIVEEFLGGFPFADDASRANAVAMLLTPFLAPMMGAAPLFAVDAPTPGTGKTLLCQAIISVFDPASAAAVAASRESEEWRKLIPGLLLEGGSHVLIDNINFRLDSPELAMAATTGVWRGRRLGSPEVQSVRSRAIWVLTGNNLSLSSELISRTVWVRLDARCARPDERIGFRQEDLLGWVTENRSRLIHAGLTLASVWAATDRPEVDLAFRNFTPWARRMGGLLGTVAIPGFLKNRETFRARADNDGLAWDGFVEAWLAAWNTVSVGASQLFEIAESCESFAEKLGDGHEQARKTRLGRILRREEGRIYAGHRIEKAGVYQGAVRYHLVPVEPEEALAGNDECEPDLRAG